MKNTKKRAILLSAIIMLLIILLVVVIINNKNNEDKIYSDTQQSTKGEPEAEEEPESNPTNIIEM